jgi:hypothetical protein
MRRGCGRIVRWKFRGNPVVNVKDEMSAEIASICNIYIYRRDDDMMREKGGRAEAEEKNLQTDLPAARRVSADT